VTWTSPTPDPVDGPMTGDDRPILVGFLAWQRATLLNVCAGLTAEQLASRPVPSSTLSLLGLVRHLAKVERIWLRQRIGGEDVPPLHGGAGDQADFAGADPSHAAEDVEQLRQEFRAADATVSGLPFDHEVTVHGDAMSLRMVYVHLIGEYGRHLGHADLLREAIDGVRAR